MHCLSQRFLKNFQKTLILAFEANSVYCPAKKWTFFRVLAHCVLLSTILLQLLKIPIHLIHPLQPTLRTKLFK